MVQREYVKTPKKDVTVSKSLGELSVMASKADFHPWPFKVNKVKIIKNKVGLVVVANNKSYALNGSALKKYAEINEIWLNNPNIPKIKIRIGHIIDWALATLK